MGRISDHLVVLINLVFFWFFASFCLEEFRDEIKSNHDLLAGDFKKMSKNRSMYLHIRNQKQTSI